MLEDIINPANLNAAYRRVKRNGGSGGVDRMTVDELLPYLRLHGGEIVHDLLDGRYMPCPVRRVEIPKDNGKMRQLGIPTAVDRVIQQAIAQVLTPVYEPQFVNTSYGFRPNGERMTPSANVRNTSTQGMSGRWTWTWRSSSTP